MKKVNKKGKFITLDNYTTIKKNNNKINLDNSASTTNIKTYEEYETPLQSLIKMFPNFSQDVIETIYEENNRTFQKTKSYLEEMCKEELEYENFDIEEELNHETNQEDNQNLYPDINSFVRFKYENDDPFIQDTSTNSTSIKNLEDFQKRKYYIDVNTILTQQKKNADDYISVFTQLANENTPKHNTNNYSKFEENYLEELTLDYYCEVLLEFFPKLSRIEIMQKICDHDFDVDKLVLGLLDENNEDMLTEDFNNLEIKDISNREEVLSNFYSGEVIEKNSSNLTQIENVLFNHNLQNQIEKEIKKKNVTSKLNVLYNEKDFPFLSEDVKSDLIKTNSISDEYFLELDIKEIKSKSIREDLTRLVKNFPFRDEFEIKWVYYQFMDYPQCFKYFKKNTRKKGMFDDNDKLDQNFNRDYNTTILDKNSNQIENTFSNSNLNDDDYDNDNIDYNNNDDNTNLLCKIISQNPNQWQIGNNMKHINISDYQSIRRKLIWQAQLAWRGGRHQDAKIIMAKASRYKQEINTLLTNKKIELFVKNNEKNQITNFMNNKENFIDLHGLNFEESKIILNKKISDIRLMKSQGVIDFSRKFVLNVITGVGNHSKDHKAVLLPRLSHFFKSLNYHMKVDRLRGIIRVYL